MNLSSAALLLLFTAGCAASPPAPLDDPTLTPEEIFRKMEARALEAPSLRIRAACEQIDRAASGEVERKSLMTLAQLRGERQFSFVVTGVDARGQVVGGALISDGTRVSARLSPSKPWVEGDAPPELKRHLATMIHRVGPTLTELNSAAVVASGASLKPSGAPPECSNFKAGETRGNLASMTYDIRDARGNGFAITLWYDRTTGTPVRRRVGDETQPGLAFDETYSDYVAGAEVPDAAFVVPDPFPDSPRRWTGDADLFLYEEREGGRLRFLLLCTGPFDIGTTDTGIILKRGGVTQRISNQTGMMIVDGNRTTMNAIPEGWDNDLAGEYSEYRAAHPGVRLRDWMIGRLKQRPSTHLEALLRKE
ncbi:MAG: hypothetical protein JO332_12135 [Planctomycetaceae bacterium]|nr:hypothetical protein [Planctomycetaceae bacterium]